MKISENELNLGNFNTLTNSKWLNEPLEFFKCKNCNLIVIGIPDCHTALTDPNDLNKSISYNLPRKISCPNYNDIWYDYPNEQNYNTDDISLEELFSSDWNKIFSKK